jgi:hypothetical protein
MIPMGSHAWILVPKNALRYRGKENSSKPKFTKAFAGGITHQAAMEKCDALGASLASIHSDAENAFIGG